MLKLLLLCHQLGTAGQVDLLPDGLLSSGQGLSAALEVGASRTSGHKSPLNQLGSRGAYAYSPSWLGELFLDVQSTQPADSMVFTRSRFGGIAHVFNRDSSQALGILSLEGAWWSQTFHLDTGSNAIEVSHSGVEAHLGMGIGGLGGRFLKGAIGVSTGMRSALIGPQKARPELLLRSQATLSMNIQDILYKRNSFSQGIGLYLKFPVQWNPFPLDPASGTGRPFALPRWEYGIRAGITGLL